MASSKFRFEVRRNGVAIPELSVSVTHEVGAKVRIPISGHTLLKLAKDDKIEMYLIPEKSAPTDPKAKKYKISAAQATLTIKKELWF